MICCPAGPACCTLAANLFCNLSLCYKSQCTDSFLHLFSSFCTQKSRCVALLIRGTFWLPKRNRKDFELIKTWLQLPPSAGIFESWLVLGETLHTTVSREGVTRKTSSKTPKFSTSGKYLELPAVSEAPETCLALSHLPNTTAILQNSMKTKCGLA